jgi:hypothetical protein
MHSGWIFASALYLIGFAITVAASIERGHIGRGIKAGFTIGLIAALWPICALGMTIAIIFGFRSRG